jgi:hypothetical protein
MSEHVDRQKKPFSMIREFHLADWFLVHPLVLIYGVSGSLMISRIRIPKL